MAWTGKTLSTSFTVQTSIQLNTKISFGREDGLGLTKAKSDATLLKEVLFKLQSQPLYCSRIIWNESVRRITYVYTKLHIPVSYSKQSNGFVTHSYSLPLSFPSTQLFSTKTMTHTKCDPSERHIIEQQSGNTRDPRCYFLNFSHSRLQCSSKYPLC